MADILYWEFDKLSDKLEVGDDIYVGGRHLHIDNVQLNDDNDIVLTCRIVEDTTEGLEKVELIIPTDHLVVGMKLWK